MAKIPKHAARGQRARLPKTLAQIRRAAAPIAARDRECRARVTRMREGVSLRSAAAEYGVDPRTVVRLGGSALRKNASGRYAAKPSDNLLRVMVVPVHGGRVEVAVRGSRAASELGKRARRSASSLAPATIPSCAS